jgi:short-subunit dehydrogenase
MAFARDGADVVLFARDLARLSETGAAIRRVCEIEPLIVRGDVTSEAQGCTTVRRTGTVAGATPSR